MVLGQQTQAPAAAPAQAAPQPQEDVAGISVMDLSGVDTSQIAEVRFERLPKGMYRFQIKEANLEQEKTKNDDDQDIPLFLLPVKLEVIAPLQLAMQHDNPESLKGKVMQHRIAKKIETHQGKDKAEQDAETFVGMVKAFAVDIGINGSMPFGEIIQQMAGVQFDGPIKHTRNKNDEDNPFVNLDTQKIKPAA